MRRHTPNSVRCDVFGSAQHMFLAGILCTVALGALSAEGLLAPGARAGEPPFKIAPGFSTFDVHGNSHALANYLDAKPILLEFMSLGCPHCVEMAPILGRAHAVYGEKMQFLTVAFDQKVKRVQRFAHAEKHAWPYLRGTEQIVQAYTLDGVPTFCCIAPGGQVMRYVVGSMPETVLRENIDALLKAK